MGFDGRSVQDDRQAAWANEAFSPQKEKVEWARNAVKAYEEKKNEGTVIYQGFEICYAAYQKAKALVVRAEEIKQKEG